MGAASSSNQLNDLGARGRAGAAATDGPSERREATFLVGGLDCRGCARNAERALAQIDGVRAAQVRFIGEMAHVAYDVRRTNEREIAEAMARAGHRLSRVDGIAPSSRYGLGRLRIAGTLIALGELAALDIAASGDPAPPTGLGVTRLALASIALVLGGSGLAQRAWRLFRENVIGREALVVVAAIASFALGCVGLRGAGSPFADWHGFEVAAGIVASTLLIHAAYSRLWTRALADLATSERARDGIARRLDAAGREETASRDSLAIGDNVRVFEGEIVPADLRLDVPALLADPSNAMAAPALRQAGDLAPSGAVLLSASASGRIARPFRAGISAAIDAEIHRVVARVERELGGWSSGDGWGDLATQALFAGAFTFAIFALAAHLALGGASSGPAAWSSAVAVLVVASPTAFVLAAPLTRVIALLRARSASVVVRDPQALDLLARADAACFEKTGTVTTGELEVSALVWLTQPPDPNLLEDILAIELGAVHAAGRAIASYLRAADLRPSTLPMGARIVETAGGASGAIRDALIEIAAPRRFPDARADGAPPGASIAWFARNGVPAGYFVLTDPLRADADTALRGLWRRGILCRLVSGDRDEAARAAGHRLGVPATGGLSPSDKALVVRDLQHAGARVLYVRDAIEAPSTGHADVSIAIAPGMLPHTVAAPIVIADGRLDRLPWLLDLARAARRRRIECCALAVAYNAVVVPLAAIGRVTPLLAAGLALLESVIVLANAARLLFYPRAPIGG